ncbi:MAG: complex I NDUFA9 subunit family protein [Alphaproteobacteria bacterium]|mgnify:CR=1 FL=1|nr:complex I NDUFA9 subunit family protein [Alphaproteobacteria bacterium]
MKQERITVIGGSGFLGRYIVELLADQGAVVKVAVRDIEKAKFLKPLGQVGQVTPIRINIRDESSLKQMVQETDKIIYLVGILYEKRNQTFQSVHIDALDVLGELSKKEGVRSFSLVSALGANVEAKSKYLSSKGKGELKLTQNYPEATIFKPSVLFGAEDKFFNLFASLLRMTPMLPLYGGGKTLFQPVYVSDVARAIVNSIDDKSTYGNTYELGGPTIYTYTELMEVILRYTNRNRLLLPVPFKVGDLQAALVELLPKPILTRDQMISLRVNNVVHEDALNIKKLGVEPTSLETILPTYLKRYRKGGRLGRRSDS